MKQVTIEDQDQDYKAQGNVKSLEPMQNTIPKPPKSIVESIRTLDKQSQFYKPAVVNIIHQIQAKLHSWELFSDEQIHDALKGLRIILTQLPIINLDDKLNLIFELVKLIHSSELPMKTRVGVSECVLMVFKVKIAIKAILQLTRSEKVKSILNQVFLVCLDSCNQSDNDDEDL